MAGSYEQKKANATAGTLVFTPVKSKTTEEHGAAQVEEDKYTLEQGGKVLRLVSCQSARMRESRLTAQASRTNSGAAPWLRSGYETQTWQRRSTLVASEAGATGIGAPDRQPVVLLVEDEALLRGTTAEFLRMSGYMVIEAPTTAEAVAQLTSGQTIDVVFSDVCLSSHLDGLALARWLHERRTEVPVLLTSGYGDPVRKAAVDLVGNEHFLSKPYRQEELSGRLRSLV